jgi:hypothetical protein
MGLGQFKNGRHQPITPHAGSWADTVNKTPMPAGRTNTALAIGKCNADGSGFVPYEKPIPRQWVGDLRK